MITSRFITEDDRQLLENSLAQDGYHKDTMPDFFFEESTVCSVFSDEEGVILFVRAKPFGYNGMIAIQLDIQYVNNLDAKRNMKAMLTGFPIIEERAKQEGFVGFLFQSEVPLLRKFCVKRLGFYEVTDQFLGKILEQKLLDSDTGDVIE